MSRVCMRQRENRRENRSMRQSCEQFSAVLWKVTGKRTHGPALSPNRRIEVNRETEVRRRSVRNCGRFSKEQS